MYVPDITRYANREGWIEEGNIFSQWYGQVIGHTQEYVTGEGYKPIRCGEEKSLESFCYKVRKDFLPNRDDVSARFLFDYLDSAADTLMSLLKEEPEVFTIWFEGSVASAFGEFDYSERKEMLRKLAVPVFFPTNDFGKKRDVIKRNVSLVPEQIMYELRDITSQGETMILVDNKDNPAQFLGFKMFLSLDDYAMN